MAGTIYIRQSSFADGDTITAALFNNEFNQLANAFAYTTSGTTGHTHDGTDGQGGNVSKIGDQDFKNKIVVDTVNNRWGVFVEVGGVTTEQVRIQDGAFVPVVDSDINLGSPTAYFKDSYIDTVTTTGAVTVGGALSAASFSIGGTALTATITELNTLDGITSTVTELNYTDGVTSNIQTQLNAKQPLDAQLTDIAALTPTDGTFIVGDGTNFVAEAPATALASLGVTSTATELNVLDGITATTTELNYVHNVTSPIQTQLNAKQALNAKLTDISNLTLSDNFFLVSTGSNLALESPAAALTSLGVTATAAELNYVDGVTSNVQTQLDAKSPLSSPTFTGTLTAPIINASSDLKIGGTTIAATATELNYLSGVTSSVQTQLDALQASDTDLSAIAALTPSDGNFIVGNGTSWVAESGNTVIASLGVTATAAEINTLDGITATTTELNYTDGVTSNIQTQLDAKAETLGDLGAFSSATLAEALTDETGTGAAVFGTNPVIDGVTVPARTNPLAKSVRVAMTAATSGGGISQLYNDNYFLSNTSQVLFFRCAANWSSATKFYLSNRQTSTATNGSNIVCTSGLLRIEARNIGTGSNTAFGTSTQTVPVADGEIAFIAFDLDLQSDGSGVVRWYVNGLQLGASVTVTAVQLGYFWQGITSTHFNRATDGSRVAADFIERGFYNRHLTDAEHFSLCVNGVDPADIGANQVAVYESDFSVNADGFLGYVTINTGNFDGIAGEDDWLQIRVGGSLNFHYSYRSFSMEIGKRYNLKLKYYIDSSENSNLSRIDVRNQSGQASVAGSRFGVLDTFDAVTEVSLDFVATSTQIQLQMINSVPTSVWTGNSTDAFYIKDFEISQVGITGLWDAKDAQSDTGQIFDSSGNKNHALLPAAGATIIGKETTQVRQVRWTNIWDGTNELQYIGGTNQAILPANAYIESIVGTVSGATPHDIIIGNGSDTDRYVTLTTGLAAGVTSFALASRVTDGTNLKLTVDPDANATMSIAWVITYTTLES